MYDAFISHSSKDKTKYVYELRDYMIEHGCKIWLDEDNILTGDNILSEIKKGIEKSLCVILVLTEDFFNSNWTSLEIGMALSDSAIQIIPVIAGVPKSFVAEKLPLLLNKKYLYLEQKNIATCAKTLLLDITNLRERRKKTDPLNYHKKIRELNNFDSPITNKLSILIAEYEQICKISVDTGSFHATKIAVAIIDDVYTRTRKFNDLTNITSMEKLELLLERTSGLNQGVCEHFNSLITTVSSTIAVFANDANKKMMTDLSIASILDWYLAYISVILRKNKNNERIDTVWYNEMTYEDFLDMYEIDQQVLRPDLIAKPEVAYKWYQYNNFSHIAVRSNKTSKIVGYFTLFPVTDDLYEDIKSGDFKDNELDTKDIRRYDFPDFYKLYVACVCIHPNYHNTTVFHKLYSSLIKMMYDLATEKEVYITDIITEAST